MVDNSHRKHISAECPRVLKSGVQEGTCSAKEVSHLAAKVPPIITGTAYIKVKRYCLQCRYARRGGQAILPVAG